MDLQVCFVSDTQARWSTVQLHRVEAGFEVLGAYFAGYRLEFSTLRPHRRLALDSNCGKWIGRGDIETFVDCCIANSAERMFGGHFVIDLGRRHCQNSA